MRNKTLVATVEKVAVAAIGATAVVLAALINSHSLPNLSGPPLVTLRPMCGPASPEQVCGLRVSDTKAASPPCSLIDVTVIDASSSGKLHVQGLRGCATPQDGTRLVLGLGEGPVHLIKGGVDVYGLPPEDPTSRGVWDHFEAAYDRYRRDFPELPPLGPNAGIQLSVFGSSAESFAKVLRYFEKQPSLPWDVRQQISRDLREVVPRPLAPGLAPPVPGPYAPRNPKQPDTPLLRESKDVESFLAKVTAEQGACRDSLVLAKARFSASLTFGGGRLRISAVQSTGTLEWTRCMRGAFDRVGPPPKNASGQFDGWSNTHVAQPSH